MSKLRAADNLENEYIEEKKNQEKRLFKNRQFMKKLAKAGLILGISAAVIFGVRSMQRKTDVRTTDGPQTVISGDPEPGMGNEEEKVVENAGGSGGSKVDVTKGQDLKDQKKNTITAENVDEGEAKVEKEEATEVKYVDNTKEEETTKAAVEKAEEENIKVVQGEVKDKDGNSTGEKITATEGRTTDVNIQNRQVEETTVQVQEETKTAKKQIDISNSKKSESVNKNTSSPEVRAKTDKELDDDYQI